MPIKKLHDRRRCRSGRRGRVGGGGGGSRGRTKPSWNLWSVERLINEVLGMHRCLMSFVEKVNTNEIHSGRGPLVSQEQQFLFRRRFSSLILCISNLTINHCDILVDWTFTYLWYCLTSYMLCFPSLDEEPPKRRDCHICLGLSLLCQLHAFGLGRLWAPGEKEWSLFIPVFSAVSTEGDRYSPVWNEWGWTWWSGCPLHHTLSWSPGRLRGGPSACVPAKWHLDSGPRGVVVAEPSHLPLNMTAFCHQPCPPLTQSQSQKILHNGPGGPFCIAVACTSHFPFAWSKSSYHLLLLSLFCVLW